MKMTKKILAILISAVLLLGLLAGCNQGTTPSQTDPQNGTVGTPRADGMLVFSSDASVNITYDEEGLVMSIEGTNAEGSALAEEYTEFLGKSCADVVKDLVTMSIENDYFTRNIVIKQAMGSALPGTNLLDAIASEAQAAADATSATAVVILISEENLDDSGYIDLATAKSILLSHLNINATTTFDGDPAPKDGAYTFYLVSKDIEGYFSVDAVSGVASELSEADMDVQEDDNNENIPQNEETSTDASDATEVGSESSATINETVEDTKSAEETTTAEVEEPAEVTAEATEAAA